MDLIENLLTEETTEKTRYVYVNSQTGELIHFPVGVRNSITQEEFKEIADQTLDQEDSVNSYLIKRDQVYVSVLSKDDIYDWSFLLNFNDYGCITGEFRVDTENEESNYPYYIGTKIQEKIFQVLKKRISQDLEGEYLERRIIKRKPSDYFVEKCSIVLLALFLTGVAINETVSKVLHQKAGDIQINYSSKSLIDEDYEYAYKVLESSGFKNITLVKKNDLITGIIDGEHTVESISIGGDQKFSKGDWFDPDSEIIIEYHAYLLE